jgi:hypothetical protein
MAANDSATSASVCPSCGLDVDVSKPHLRLFSMPDVAFHDDRCLGVYEGRKMALAELIDAVTIGFEAGYEAYASGRVGRSGPARDEAIRLAIEKVRR